MIDLSKRTKGPWYLSKHSGGTKEEQDIQTSAGWFLRLSVGASFKELVDPEDAREEFEANTAFIVRAENCWNDLVDALQWIVDREGECLSDHPEVLAEMRARLARAKGEA